MVQPRPARGLRLNDSVALAFANDGDHVGTPPAQAGGELVWDTRKPDTTGVEHHLIARVKCRLPATTTTLDAGS